jgi:hypothetical protein
MNAQIQLLPVLFPVAGLLFQVSSLRVKFADLDSTRETVMDFSFGTHGTAGREGSFGDGFACQCAYIEFNVGNPLGGVCFVDINICCTFPVGCSIRVFLESGTVVDGKRIESVAKFHFEHWTPGGVAFSASPFKVATIAIFILQAKAISSAPACSFSFTKFNQAFPVEI